MHPGPRPQTTQATAASAHTQPNTGSGNVTPAASTPASLTDAVLPQVQTVTSPGGTLYNFPINPTITNMSSTVTGTGLTTRTAHSASGSSGHMSAATMHPIPNAMQATTSPNTVPTASSTISRAGGTAGVALPAQAQSAAEGGPTCEVNALIEQIRHLQGEYAYLHCD